MGFIFLPRIKTNFFSPINSTADDTMKAINTDIEADTPIKVLNNCLIIIKSRKDEENTAA